MSRRTGPVLPVLAFLVLCTASCTPTATMKGRTPDGYAKTAKTRARDGKVTDRIRKMAEKAELALFMAKTHPRWAPVNQGHFRKLIAYLEDVSPAVRKAAAEGLRDFDDPRAVKPLLERYHKEKVEVVRREIVSTVGSIGRSVEVVDFLLERKETLALTKIVYSTDNERREARERAVAALITMLREDEDEKVRIGATSRLGSLKVGAVSSGLREKAYQQLVKSLREDKSVRVRRGSVIDVYALGKERAVEPLKAALGDADSEVKVKAADKLALLGDKSGFELAIALLKDEEERPTVRATAVMALRAMRDKRAIPVLKALLPKVVDGNLRTDISGVLRSSEEW